MGGGGGGANKASHDGMSAGTRGWYVCGHCSESVLVKTLPLYTCKILARDEVSIQHAQFGNTACRLTKMCAPKD